MAPVDAQKIFSLTVAEAEPAALALFRYQVAHNPVYRQYADSLHIQTNTVNSLLQVPFLPISLFKTHKIYAAETTPEIVFESSGTTGMQPSRHYLKDAALYRQSFNTAFTQFYGPPQNWCIIGLLPSYLERSGSSLVYMVNDLVEASGHPLSGFYLYEHDQLYLFLQELEKDQQPTLLIGVTYALLDFAARYNMQLKHTVVMETGGMKGRREELTRPQVHAYLQQRLGLQTVHSEYGMTELLSQAYSPGGGIFSCPPWMRALVREEDDPLTVHATGRGALNIVDLANIHSCAFIATEDAGRVHANGTFEILGRLDGSDIRGCGLMYQPE